MDNEPLLDTTTPAQLRRLAKELQQALASNQGARALHPDDPARFVDSEVALDEKIHLVQPVSVASALCDELAASSIPRTLAEIIAGHENDDIVADAVAVIAEWTDADVTSETFLTRGLQEGNIVTAIVTRLGDESCSSHAAMLPVLEAALEADDKLVPPPALLPFLLANVEALPTASDVLVLLVPRLAADARASVVDPCLALLAKQRRADDDGTLSREDAEVVLNLLDVLVLVPPSSGEAMALLLRLVRDRSRFGPRALAVLDAMLDGNGSEPAVAFVQAMGLKTLFALLMGKGKHVGKYSEEHIVGILHMLVHGLPKDSVERARLVHKFREADFCKLERIYELQRELTARVSEAAVDEEEENDEEAVLLAEVAAGRLTLDKVDEILDRLTGEHRSIAKRLAMLKAKFEEAPEDEVRE